MQHLHKIQNTKGATVATISKSPKSEEKENEEVQDSIKEKIIETKKSPKPKQANRSPKKPKLDPNELVTCEGSFTKVARKDMSKKFGGKYSKAFIEAKGL